MENQHMTEDSKVKILAELHTLLDSNSVSLDDVVKLLSPLPLNHRREIIHMKDEFKCGRKQTVFFRSCINKKLDVVKYFLENCNADVEERCTYTVTKDNNSTHDVPPIWVAAITGQADLAELLLDHGTDVNGMSDSNSTALRASCYNNDLGMVKFLVSKGADVNIPNNHGCTCLMNAAESTDIIKHLIENGADINARETRKLQLTALHYAIHNHNVEGAQLLVDAGADLTIQDKDGNEPLISAALLSEYEIVEFLCSKGNTNPEDMRKAYELLASAEFDEGKESGLKYLKKALILEKEKCLKQQPIPTEPFQHLLPNVTLPSTVDEIDIMTNTVKALHTLSVLIKSRYFSPLDYEFLYGLLQYATCQFMNREYHSALPTCSFAYERYLEKRKWLHDNAIYSIVMATVSSANIIQQDPDGTITSVCKIFHSMVHQVKESILEDKRWKDNQKSENFTCLMKVSLYVITLILHHSSKPLQIQFMDDVRQLIAINPRTKDGNTLLHELVDVCHNMRIDDPRYCYMFEYLKPGPGSYPSMDLKTISFLLSNGLNPNQRNKKGQTVLHTLFAQPLLLKNSEYSEEFSYEKVTYLLLENGAHIDAVDDMGNSCLNLIHRVGMAIPEVNFLTLQCLASNAVIQHNIPYEDSLPAEVISFVKLHMPSSWIPSTTKKQ